MTSTVVDDPIDDNADLDEESQCNRCCVNCWHCRGTTKWHNPMSKGPGWIPFYILMYILLGLWFAVLFPFSFCCIDCCFFCHEGVPSIKERRTKSIVVEQSQTITAQPTTAGPPPPAYVHNQMPQPSISMQQHQSITVHTHVERY